ncbi:MAG: BNR-4 repeat-containing protein, partial [Thermoguttaceae bacterium]
HPSGTRTLTWRFHLPAAAAFAFRIRDRSNPSRAMVGARFDVAVNGQILHRAHWPWPEAPYELPLEYYVVLPKGATTVSFEVVGGYAPAFVEIDRYQLAQSSFDLADDDPPAVPLPHLPAMDLRNQRVDGFRGIWYAQQQVTEYGDKYSGGLGTYTAKHRPLAVHCPEKNRTYFVYGGQVPLPTTTLASETANRYLVPMAAYYDHAAHRVAQPVIVHDSGGVNDPHNNPSLALDEQGYLYVFVAGRATGQPGFVYKSVEPHRIDAFERLWSGPMNYPQPWYVPEKGFFLNFTQYTRGRELYFCRSDDGRTWSAPVKLAGFGGHYQVSELHGTTMGVAFNYHPGGNVDRRTQLYYVQTTDGGRTWTTAGGERVALPLDDARNDALVFDYEADGRLVYVKDLAFDAQGRPIVLHLTSGGAEAGPANDPRRWLVARFNGESWERFEIAQSDHNYDMGSLYVADGRWTLLGPTETGPQPFQTGGEIALWSSTDEGRTWSRSRQVTRNSPMNHNYVRRPLGATDPFHAFWADGDPTRPSRSRLFFTNSRGEPTYMLPERMETDTAEPIPVE